ncbi:MAG: hypothetical protein JWR05_3692 [Mucilaginibacter sp.]|nr:hypothetical protein [Mucilaginibacter sp.]
MSRLVVVDAERWILRDGERSEDRVPIGDHGWTLPAWYRWTLDHSSEPFLLRLHCAFNGGRVDVKEVAVRSRNGRSITARDLSAVELARAVYLLTESQLTPEHARPTDRRPGRRVDDEELRLLASVYAFEFAAWGNPRQAVMGLWELPRATANRWIRKARELYSNVMPGDGGDVDGQHREET